MTKAAERIDQDLKEDDEEADGKAKNKFEWEEDDFDCSL